MPPSSHPNRRMSIADSVRSSVLADDIDAAEQERFSLDAHDPLNPAINLQQPTQPLHRRILAIFALILLWYTFSLLLSLYNKWMFAPAHLNFPFPLFVTSLHMVVQFGLSGLVLWIFPQLRPKRLDWMTPRDYTFVSSLEIPNVSLKIGPCGAA